ncbi:DUF6040 family protein [Dorea sp. AM58-8]|nr:DUF6040 family protein [Dorea sp. AM58-8]
MIDITTTFAVISWKTSSTNKLLLLLVQVIYIGIRCYVKDWREERGYY